MLPTSCLLLFTFFIEELILKRKEHTKKNKIKLLLSLFIASILIVVYLLIVFISTRNCAIVSNFNKISQIFDIGKSLELVKNTCIKSICYYYGNLKVHSYHIVMIIFATILCVIGSKNNIKQAVIFWSQLIFTILIHTFLWFVSVSRVYIVIYTLMFWLWNYKEDKQYKKNPKDNIYIQIALIILIILSVPGSLKICVQDFKGNFSTGKITAQYIEANIQQGACFIYANEELQQSIIAYLKKDKYKFYSINSANFGTFITWNDKWNHIVKISDIEKTIKQMKKIYNDVYVIRLDKFTQEFIIKNNLKLVFSSEGKCIDNIYTAKEIYNIYKVE